MTYTEHHSDDVDELSALLNQGAWQARLVQLTSGPLGYESRGAAVPGLSVRFLRYGQGLYFEESLSGSQLNFALLLEAACGVRMAGQEFGRTEVLVRGPGDAVEYASSRATRSLSITVDPALLGWSRPPRGRFSLADSAPLRLELLAACRAWVASVGTGCESTPTDADDPFGHAGHRVLDRVRELSARMIEPTSASGACLDRARLVARARQRLAQKGPSLSVGTLAKELGVSERSLFRAFQQCVGVGPREFDQARRLHELRARLLAWGPGRGHVARAATQAGFTHLGRLSRLYRDHFGELPSETASRGAGIREPSRRPAAPAGPAAPAFGT